MSNSWDAYYNRYSDWDESHIFNVKIKLEYEKELLELGYSSFKQVDINDFIPNNNYSRNISEKGKYIKNDKSLELSFEAPYDWSIDSDWEDKALELLNIKDEWVIDSMVEDD